MTSINTNTSAMAALATLRTISDAMDTTQAHVSSGFRVGSAADNSAYWSIATTMRSDEKALSTVNDALGIAASKADIASAGLDNAISIVSEIKSKLMSARDPSVDKLKVNVEIQSLKDQLIAVAKSASFNNENWLFNSAIAGTAVGTKEMVGSFTRDSSGNISVGTIAINTANTTLVDVVNANKGLLTKGVQVVEALAGTTNTSTATYFLVNASSTNSAFVSGGSGNPNITAVEMKLFTTTTVQNIDGMVKAVDGILANLTNAGSQIGSVAKGIKLQDNFVTNVRAAIQRGIGRLVDADMNEESSKLKALQTQQQLAIQSLTIANSNSQNILQLFR